MPESSEPGKFLRGGEFYSPVQARMKTGDFVLSELRQPCSRLVPRHEHELAYVTVMLHGDYMEGDHGKLAEMEPFSAVFNPAGVTHSTVIGPSGASLFTVEFRREAIQALDLRLPDRPVFDHGGGLDRGTGSIFWPGLSLYSALKSQTADPLVVETGIFEMLAAIAPYGRTEKHTSEKPAPEWFGHVKERLHEEFRDHLRVQDLAMDAGVHPVHLARVFRQIEKQTPGEYQQRLQVRAACELMHDPDWQLAAIAAECGFADQSHFTRVFGRIAGMTPARFRKAILPGGDAAPIKKKFS